MFSVVFGGIEWEHLHEIGYWDKVGLFEGGDLFRIHLFDKIVAFSRRKT